MSSLVTLIVAAGAFLALAYLYLIPGSVFIRFFIAVVVLIISGYMITNANRHKGAFGVYLLGGERGISVVEGLAKRNKGFWKCFADWGISLSFGILAYFFFRKQIGIKPLILGIATVAFVIIFVSPYLPLILSFINMPGINTGVSSAPAQGVGPLFYPFFVISLIGGFSFYIILLLIYSGASLLYTLAIAALKFIASNPSGALSTLQTQIPGVTPVIPGITIPFFAGIISLIILLVVHEFSHGILSSLAKVKIKSIGIVLFGIIPMGAFVEPDERQITKLSVQKQNRIFIAGISANMVACLFFFVLTFAMLYYVLPNVNTGGVLVTVRGPKLPRERDHSRELDYTQVEQRHDKELVRPCNRGGRIRSLQQGGLDNEPWRIRNNADQRRKTGHRHRPRDDVRLLPGGGVHLRHRCALFRA